MDSNNEEDKDEKTLLCHMAFSDNDKVINNDSFHSLDDVNEYVELCDDLCKAKMNVYLSKRSYHLWKMTLNHYKEKIMFKEDILTFFFLVTEETITKKESYWIKP